MNYTYDFNLLYFEAMRFFTCPIGSSRDSTLPTDSRKIYFIREKSTSS